MSDPLMPTIAERAERQRVVEDIVDDLVAAAGVLDLIARAMVAGDATGVDDLQYTPRSLAYAAQQALDLAELVAATVTGREPRWSVPEPLLGTTSKGAPA